MARSYLLDAVTRATSSLLWQKIFFSGELAVFMLLLFVADVKFVAAHPLMSMLISVRKARAAGVGLKSLHATYSTRFGPSMTGTVVN